MQINPVTVFDAATSTGQSSVVVPLSEMRLAAQVLIEVSGSPTGLGLTIQGLFVDGGTRYGLQVTKLDDGTTIASITATGLYRVDGSGLSGLSGNVTAITGGSVTVKVRPAIG